MGWDFRKFLWCDEMFKAQAQMNDVSLIVRFCCLMTSFAVPIKLFGVPSTQTHQLPNLKNLEMRKMNTHRSVPSELPGCRATPCDALVMFFERRASQSHAVRQVSSGKVEIYSINDRLEERVFQGIFGTKLPGARTLLGAPGLTTRSKDATRGSWPYY